MPLCPRCGAAHLHDDEVCRECGKRLREQTRVVADQTSLYFPICVDGPVGCEGPAVKRQDGRIRCSTHHLNTQVTVRRIPDKTPLACIDGPDACRGVISLQLDGQLRCVDHQELMDRPTWKAVVRRWLGFSGERNG